MKRNHVKTLKVTAPSTLMLAFTIFSLLMTSCVPTRDVSSRRSSTARSTDNGSGPGSGNGQGAVPGDGGISAGDEELINGRAELRHIVDPFDGTYKTKVTIPKNFTGLLYLSGLNFTSLAGKLVSARFRFGRELEPVVIQGTIGRAPGITPQTDIEVLILDFQDRPFENIRLLYDLYDYNDYRSDINPLLEDKAPTNDPRDTGLYCRGLRTEHDPTFISTPSNPNCGVAGNRCLYSYAKLKDSGLIVKSSGIALVPSEPQVDLAGGGYTLDPLTNTLKKCLPDNNNAGNLNTALNSNIAGALAYGLDITPNIFPEIHQYKGPFRPLATDEWHISGSAILSDVTSPSYPSGLFQFSMNSDPNNLVEYADGGYRSFMFPRAGTMPLSSGVDYLGNLSDPYGLKTLDTLLTSGDSKFMGGCNIRASNYDSFANEHIGSCNVVATIELIHTNLLTNQEEVLTSSTAVKLQLSRASITNFQGQEVLYSSLSSCSSSQTCGSNECCFNSRCWDKELVTQCLEDVAVVGNRGVGEVCNSDFECSSLCCNQSTGACSVHINDNENRVLCSKAPGQSCVMKEYCREENLSTCFIVNTGLDLQGQQLCSLRCYNVPTFGECINGICAPPPIPSVPIFDPTNPDCTTAIDPPTGF
jgi:hypothetical protein